VFKASDILSKSNNLHMALISNNKPTEFPPESYVLVKYRTGAPPTRRRTGWNGPFRVISSNHFLYQLLNLVQNRQKAYHVTDIKAFEYDRSNQLENIKYSILHSQHILLLLICLTLSYIVYSFNNINKSSYKYRYSNTITTHE
jgi:hypothetical protein